jgi:hypothetical protein
VRLAAASSSNDIDPDESHTKSLDVFFVPDRSDDANAPAEWRLTVTEKRSLPHPSTEGMFGPTFDETVDVTGRLFKLKWYKSDAGIPVTRAILDRAEAWMRTDGSLATFRDTEEIYDEWQNESEEGNESS